MGRVESSGLQRIIGGILGCGSMMAATIVLAHPKGYVIRLRGFPSYAKTTRDGSHLTGSGLLKPKDGTDAALNEGAREQPRQLMSGLPSGAVAGDDPIDAHAADLFQ